MVDAQVDGDADLIGHIAEIDHLVFRKGAVLAVRHDKPVVVLAEDVLELRLRGIHRSRNADHDIASADAFF